MKTLVIIPCGHKKIWDSNPNAGPTAAQNTYTGGPFQMNRRYAVKFSTFWMILSAKYGLISPDFTIPGPYDVSFNHPKSNPVSIETVRKQVSELYLRDCDQVTCLGGEAYREICLLAFAPKKVEFPFAGLSIGKAMQAILLAVKG